MKKNKTISHKLIMLFALSLFYNISYSQNQIHPLSFKANQGNYEDSYCEYYYQIKKTDDGYQLIDLQERAVLQGIFDTISKNAYFIKTVSGDAISIYRSNTLEKIEIPNLQQVYFKRDGLEVLSTEGAQYYDTNVAKIEAFPELDLFRCGNVYSERFKLRYNKTINNYFIELSEGNFGGIEQKTTLELKGLPTAIERLSFVNNSDYIAKDINNSYRMYPELIKIISNGKSGIYSYTIDDAVFTKKQKKKKPPLHGYSIDKITGDTIKYDIPELIEPISFNKKGTIALKEVLPVVYDQINQSLNDGLVYLFKDKQIGIYPNHTETSFDLFNQHTSSFYEIS